MRAMIASLVLGGLAAVAVSDALIAGHQLLWTWPTTDITRARRIAMPAPMPQTMLT